MKRLYLMIVLIMMLTVSVIPIYATDYDYTDITNTNVVYVASTDINFGTTPTTVKFSLFGPLYPSETPQQLLNTIYSGLSVNDMVVINLPGTLNDNISRASLIDPSTGYVEINNVGMIQIKKASEYLYLAFYHRDFNKVLAQIRIPNENVISTNFIITMSRDSSQNSYEVGYQNGYNEARGIYGILYNSN